MPLLSGDGWDDLKIVEASRRLDVPNIDLTTHRFLDVDTPEMQGFIAAYTAKSGAAPPNACAPLLGFDMVNLLVDAIGRGGATEPARLRDALAATQGFPDVVGPISCAPAQRVPEQAVAMIGLDKGSLSPAWTRMPPLGRAAAGPVSRRATTIRGGGTACA